MPETWKKRVGVSGLVLIAFLAGFYFRAYAVPEIFKVEGIKDLEEGKPSDVSFESFWKAWNLLNEKYVDSQNVPTEEKVWGAIQGLANSFGDPYTVFLPPEDKEMLEADISGRFEGVGMEVGIRDEMLTVISPLKGTPADRAGVLPGDSILQINGTSTLGMTVDEAVKHIRGEGGTTVTLTMAREGLSEPLEISVTRDVIEIPTIETREEGGVFVIELYNFNANSTELFRDALQNFIDSGKEKLVLDLRNNPGGYLEASIDISSWFLPAGKVVVIEDYGPEEKQKVHRSKGYDVFTEDLEMVVLVNGGSASASEIVAGALGEHGIATLVGEKTFGKGSVQELVSITSNTSLKVTVAKWLTPEGNSISDGGLVPEIEVEMTLEDIESDRDPQFDRALEILRD